MRQLILNVGEVLDAGYVEMTPGAIIKVSELAPSNIQLNSLLLLLKLLLQRLILSPALMLNIKLLRVVHVFCRWRNGLRGRRLQGLRLRGCFDMAHLIVTIALVMLTRVMRQGVVVWMLLLVMLRNVLDFLVLGALRFLLPLVVGRLLGVVELRLPLRGECEAATALRHLLQSRNVLVVNQRELRNRMITIRPRAVQPLQVDARARVGSVASLILPAVGATDNLHIILEW